LILAVCIGPSSLRESEWDRLLC